MRRLVLSGALLALAACGDNIKANARDDAGIDATDHRLVGCLDEPGLSAAPNGRLPCDLVPPGLAIGEAGQ
jgi:hypothetical protein